MIADRRLYTDRAGTLVEESDPAAAWMLCAKGSELEPEDVKRLGLWLDNGRVQQGPKHEPVVAMPEPEPEGDAPTPIMPPQSRRSRKRY